MRGNKRFLREQLRRLRMELMQVWADRSHGFDYDEALRLQLAIREIIRKLDART